MNFMSIFKADPYHDAEGRFASSEGAAGVIEADRPKFRELKSKQAQINTSLLEYVDNPTAPEVQEKMDQMKEVVKQIAQLHVDGGGLEGIGKPGGPKDVVVIGAGPGGMTSAIMGATDGLDTMVIEAQPNIGGQAKYSSRIENFPGFPIGVSGTKLASSMYDQATRLGAEVKTGTRVVGLVNDPKTGLKTLTMDNGEKVQARSVVIAGGVEFKKLNFPGCNSKDVIYGNGQMLTDMYKGKTVVILGGSNGAAQAALGAARTAKQVYLISRSPLAKAMSDYQVEAVSHHPKITVVENDQIKAADLDPSGDVVAVETDKGKKIDASAVGVFLGSAPSTNWLPPDIEKEEGKIKVNGDLETGVPGVFAIGDIRVGSIGRVGAAVGDGQMAERNVWGYFAKNGYVSEDTTKRDVVVKAEKLGDLFDSLFDLDREYPEPLSSYVEEEPVNLDFGKILKSNPYHAAMVCVQKGDPYHDKEGRFAKAADAYLGAHEFAHVAGQVRERLDNKSTVVGHRQTEIKPVDKTDSNSILKLEHDHQFFSSAIAAKNLSRVRSMYATYQVWIYTKITRKYT